MKKNSLKFTAFLCCLALLFSMTACSVNDHGSHSGGRHSGGDGKREHGTEATDVTDVTDPTDPTGTTAVPTTDPGNYIPTSDTLTYPDHVATMEEIHPAHKAGNVSGKEASKLLSDVEMEILHHDIDCYANAVIYFKDPEKLGYDLSDVSWGKVSGVEEYDAYKKYYQEQLDRLLTIDYNSLDGDDRICYDKMVYDMEETVYSLSYTAFEYYSMIFNSLVGPQCDILFILDVYTFDTVEEAENYITLLKDLDRYYDEMCAFEKKRVELGFISSDNSYEEAAKSFDNLVKQKDDCFLYASFEERLDNIKDLSSADKTRLISEHEKAMKEVVFPEFEECAQKMRALKGSGGTDAGLSQYRGGDAHFAMLTRRLSNSTATIPESIAVLEKRIDEINTDMKRIMGSGYGWADEYLSHSYSKGSVEQNLDFLYGAIKNDFPAIPSHQYYLMDVPKVFEDNFSPAAYLGYHLDCNDDNLIIVNTGKLDKDLGKALAHEGYPGHMYNSLYMRNQTKHPYMYLASSIGYEEGWTTYIESYSLKYFADNGITDGMKMVGYEADMSLLACTRVDYGINCEGWTLQDCLDYLNGFGFGLSADSFSEYYTLLVTDPGYYVKYGMGNVWTTQIMTEMHEKHPKATDMEIHTAYLNSLSGTYEDIRTHTDAALG